MGEPPSRLHQYCLYCVCILSYFAVDFGFCYSCVLLVYIAFAYNSSYVNIEAQSFMWTPLPGRCLQTFAGIC